MWCLLYWPCSSWVSLNHTTEIPQLGHQAGTGAVILKCDATVRDHACTKKLPNFHQELIYLYGLKANFFRVYCWNISFGHFGPKSVLTACTQLPPASAGFEWIHQRAEFDPGCNECTYFHESRILILRSGNRQATNYDHCEDAYYYFHARQ